MALDFSADNQMILDDFGVTGTFDVSGTPTAVTGLFNNAPTQNVAMFDTTIASTGPSFSFLTSALTPVHGQAVTIGGTGYLVQNIDKDGIGFTTVTLTEA